MENDKLGEMIYLSDLDWQTRSDYKAHDKGTSEADHSITLSDNNNQSVLFDKGVRMLSDSEVVYDLSTYDYHYLTAWIGVDREISDPHASLKFTIYADGVLKYESKVMTKTTPMEYTTIDISNVNILKLVLNNSQDDTEAAYGNWADIKLHKENPITRNILDVKKYRGMKLIFSEDFNGDLLNHDKWTTRTGPENGSHHYENTIGKDENIWVEDGNLVIQVKPYTGDKDYKTTSGHIVTRDNFSFQYGRVDVRAKLPVETGMWPAIWMMPQDPVYHWPMDGEIDIMELVSQTPNRIFSTIHSGVANSNNPEHYHRAGDSLDIERGTFFDDYHVYSLVWEPEKLEFYVDDILISKLTDWKNWHTNSSGEIIERKFPKPFDQPYYLKLNVATGGNWSEDVDESTRYGERTTMLVDYVRIYQ